jgi:sporulation protein YlmC with PRC-barrel domain
LFENQEVSVLVNSSKLVGKKVVGASGYFVGEVEGLDVDLENWKVTGFQVGLTNDAATEMGFKRPFLSQIIIMLPPKLVNSVGDVVTLKEAVASLKELVTYLGFR